VAERGIYNKAEEEMLDATNALFDGMAGWDEAKSRLAVTRESMLTMAHAADPFNPLWNDGEYAKGTRWGDLIAHPLFFDRLATGGIGMMPAAPELGYQHLIFIGEDWKFFRPARAGDVFRLFRRRPQVIDVTPEEGKSPRTFGLIEADKDYIGEDGQVAAQSQNYVERRFLPGPPELPGLQEYAYTMEELRYIGETMKEEKVRGAEPRYWEDVEEGEATAPAVLGPTGPVDLVKSYVATPDFLMAITPREWFLRALDEGIAEEFIPDDTPGLFYVRGGFGAWHWTTRAANAAGESLPFLFAKLSRLTMCRCLTNWMGDDGFLAAYNWRHIMRTPVGDTLVARGKVTGRRTEGDARLVDLDVWIENIRGVITEAAHATVQLPSKADPVGRR
jgi:acyl dehydratase